MIAVDVLAFAQTLLLHDAGLARAGPKTLPGRRSTSQIGDQQSNAMNHQG
jgi:hypothetical protein